ncbi:MAG TPA: hypothetical protein VGK78_17270 [Nocardioides sp.]|uniref:hypothetical protein n=1 Tax=Nocardioides sp. TaxID=35761 RepID=UPI002F3F0789
MAVVAFMLLVAGCAGGGQSSASQSGPPPVLELPTPAPGADHGSVLLLWDAHEYHPSVPVRGRLGVDEHGCFVLGDRLLEAAIGSKIIDGGRGADIRNLGRVRLGQVLTVNAELSTIGHPLGADQTTCLSGRTSVPVLVIDS